MKKEILILLFLALTIRLFSQIDTLLSFSDINNQMLFVTEESALKAFNEGKPVYRLLLSSKGYRNLPNEICNIISLQELQLPWNELTKLNPNIIKLKNLQSLNLTWNFFSKFPEEICELKNLKFLRI